MVTQKTGDLFTAEDIDVMAHQANLFCTFGAGIAAAIRLGFPEAYEIDAKTKAGDTSKLGTYSYAAVTSPAAKRLKAIVNLYCQAGLGSKDRMTSYDAMVNVLVKLRDTLEAKHPDWTLGLPWRMGCGLANGSWPIVEAIIKDVFGKSKVNVIIYQRPEDAAAAK